MKIWLIIFFCCMVHMNAQAQETSDVRLAMAGLSHGHSHWIFQDEFKGDFSLIAIYEPNEDLAGQFQKQYGLDSELFYTDLEEMLDLVKPDGLLAFGPVYDHLKVVEAAAPRGIHVMVEKPLAVSWEHAQQMEQLAKANNIHLLTNYETSWYPSTMKAKSLLQEEEKFGALRKVVFHHGHRGPKEIGVGKEFLEWLTDPKLNGGGALVDFGCYGANIMTYFLNGQKPLSVTAVTQQHKPEIYTDVEDEATIILTYPQTQAIIQASWNWPIDRKDLEAYAVKGQLTAPDPHTIYVQTREMKDKEKLPLQKGEGVYPNPFQYFTDVILGKVEMKPYSLYSLENNVIVVAILEAAKLSAKTGQTVRME
jgi:predicted dehydrogenase